MLRIFLLLLLPHFSVGEETRDHYIVMLHDKNALEMTAAFGDAAGWYSSILASVSGSATMGYAYEHVFNGFSASMTAAEAEALGQLSGVVLSVIPDKKYELQTTRTPDFMEFGESPWLSPGLPRWHDYNVSSLSDVVVAVLDSGVWPESKSFDDGGLPPVPSSWKGDCECGTNFTGSNCNRKLIGARYFSKGYEAAQGPIDELVECKSPRDDAGHGTHTASTAAGSPVPGASFLGYAPGVARGMAPRARIAAYKVCWLGGCFGSDITAGIDKAIHDNVNIISLSLGGEANEEYETDLIAIGAYSATEKGIFVSCSAGNIGPTPSTLGNVAPWITTVGAGTLDRDFPANVLLGNGETFPGVSFYKGKESLPHNATLALVYAGNASNNASGGNFCLNGTLIPKMIRGKIVLCDRDNSPRVEKGYVVKMAGGIGMVLTNGQQDGEELMPNAHVIPATLVGYKAGIWIKEYLNSHKGGARATIIFHGTKLGVKPSPLVAEFSSRGPNGLNPEILKPDLIAPGVNILASVRRGANPTGFPFDTRRVDFNIDSGTSMSCPHVSGIAAVLKGAHSDWSPAAIRSALMTTAYSTYRDVGAGGLLDAATRKPATPFDFGSGHVDPPSAIDPGLVYDINPSDYFHFLCASGYNSKQIHAVTRRNATCDPKKKYNVRHLNYPSFAVIFNGSSRVVKHKRTLTNVRPVTGTYTVQVDMSGPVKVSVKPKTLSFNHMNDKKEYAVTFTDEKPKSTAAAPPHFGRIQWVSMDKKTQVTSPVAISWL